MCIVVKSHIFCIFPGPSVTKKTLQALGQDHTCNKVPDVERPKAVKLVVRVLQEIGLNSLDWNANKFSHLLQMLYSFCEIPEIVSEIFIPFLVSAGRFHPIYLKHTLVELHKVVAKLESVELRTNLINALEKQADYLLRDNRISRYTADELLTLIAQLLEHMIFKDPACTLTYKSIESIYTKIFLQKIVWINVSRLGDTIGLYTSRHQSKLTDPRVYPEHLIAEDTLRHLYLKYTKKQYMDVADELMQKPTSWLKWKSHAETCDNIIRLTLETCLLCLEYPEVGSPDSISFLLRCLVEFLGAVPTSKNSGKREQFHRELCASLNKHAAILKDGIEHTAIADAYSELLKGFRESHSLATHLTALEQFASGCMQEYEKLRIFEGPHSPRAIGVWLAHDIVVAALDEDTNPEDYMRKLGKYFEPGRS